MSLYIIKDDDGNVLTNDGDFDNNIVYAALYYEPLEPAKDIKRYGGHVVTLTEEPEKVVVSEEEAEMLRMAKTSGHPYGYIYAHTHTAVNEDRLMRAYVNGYTVVKDKKYLLPMDGTLEENDDNDNFQLYAYCYRGRWMVDEDETDPSYKHHTVTKKELDTAPEWVKAITPVEVTDDDAK